MHASRVRCGARIAAQARVGGLCMPRSAHACQIVGSSAVQASSLSWTSRPLIQRRSLFTRKQPKPVRTTIKWTLLAFALTFGVAYHLDSRSAIHRWLAIPVLQNVTDPETAQKLAVKALSLGIMPRDMGVDDEVLAADIAGLALKNPIGLAAGFDKQAEAIDGLLNLGFGIVEVGSVTPEPQPGNEKPRYFRLEADHGAINRFGFNSDGHEVILHRLRERIQHWLLRSSTLAKSRIPVPDSESATHKLLEEATPDTVLATDHLPKSLRPGQLLAVNLGKNKTSPADSADDYVKGVSKLGPYADLLVVNVSSPNTPGLRGMQRKSILADLMGQVVKARDDLPLRRQSKVPILVKIAPDLDRQELHDIADAALASGVEGLIVSNTTVSRPSSLQSAPEVTRETGGLSGAPLKPLSLTALQTVRKRVGDRLTIIGCGGIFSGEDALDFARAGADAVELYTSFGYEGVGHPRRIKDELTALLKAQGTTWRDSVGKGIKEEDKLMKLPVNERETKAIGNVQDRLGQTMAGIKGEIEEWRRTLGMQAAVAKEKITDEQQLPPSPPKTAQQAIFRPDPADQQYSALLNKVHEALGVEPDEDLHADSLTSDLASTLTKAEEQRVRVGMALQQPNVAPAHVLEGAGDDAIVSNGQQPTSGRVQQQLTFAEPRGAGAESSSSRGTFRRTPSSSSSSTANLAANEGLLGMGGKSEFNAADRKRVV